MCTLVPMRSVPHRVVCLLGLDDGAFPRQPTVDGDNILLRDPITGERDERSEDRQLLLDAILAAREQLVITYSGADERTNAMRPPAVPVGELLDTLEASFRTDERRRPLRRQLLTRHPLQPFDPANFAAGALGVPQPFSFDPTALGGARAIVAPRRLRRRTSLAAPLPGAAQRDLELDTLRQFFEHPVRGFLRQRLGVTLPRRDEEATDRLPMSSIAGAVADRPADARCPAVRRRPGALPAGRVAARRAAARSARGTGAG